MYHRQLSRPGDDSPRAHTAPGQSRHMNMAGEPRVRILIVDDHPMVREGLRGMLSTASNLEVVGEAGTAHDAVAQAQALQPDVILLDIQLPDMDGVTALTQLKSVAACAHVLMVTVHEETAYMLQAVMAGGGGRSFLRGGRAERRVPPRT